MEYLIGSPSSRRAWIEIFLPGRSCCLRRVALLAEGVDRNRKRLSNRRRRTGSPSSRRAWIEIGDLRRPYGIPLVALLAEGVDRNWTM